MNTSVEFTGLFSFAKLSTMSAETMFGADLKTAAVLFDRVLFDWPKDDSFEKTIRRAATDSGVTDAIAGELIAFVAPVQSLVPEYHFLEAGLSEDLSAVRERLYRLYLEKSLSRPHSGSDYAEMREAAWVRDSNIHRSLLSTRMITQAKRIHIYSTAIYLNYGQRPGPGHLRGLQNRRER